MNENKETSQDAESDTTQKENPKKHSKLHKLVLLFAILVNITILLNAIFGWNGPFKNTDKPHEDYCGKIALSLSPDGKILASSSDHYTFTLWDVSDVHNVKKLSISEKQENVVDYLQFSPNGKLLASSSGDISLHDNLKIWNISDAKNQKLHVELGKYKSACFSSDWSILATSNSEFIFNSKLSSKVQLWDTSDMSNIEEICTLDGQGGGANSFCFSPDDKILAFGSSILDPKKQHISFYDNQGIINLWDISDVSNVKKLPELKTQSNTISSICFSPDGKILVSGSSAYRAIFAERFGEIIFWDISEPGNTKEIFIEQNHNAKISSLKFSSYGDILASSSSTTNKVIKDIDDMFTGQIMVWSTQNENYIKLMRQINQKNECGICGLNFSHSGRHLFSISWKPTNMLDIKDHMISKIEISIWDVRTGKLVNSLK
ncbi:MAG: hypothetical protein K8S87_05075 [Planctomycetes bacterium]|nr:hypothetical protein [Planctomycetota bacterium]